MLAAGLAWDRNLGDRECGFSGARPAAGSWWLGSARSELASLDPLRSCVAIYR